MHVASAHLREAAWFLRRSSPAPELVDRAIAAVPAIFEQWEDLPRVSHSLMSHSLMSQTMATIAWTSLTNVVEACHYGANGTMRAGTVALGSAPELRLDTMATYTTLFSATLAELEERFPHVADPLPVPRVTQRTNPFTKLSVQVMAYEPEFDAPRHRLSLFAEGGPASVKPIHGQLDDYDRYLRGLVPTRLRSLPHIGTKNVSFADATELLSLEEVRPEKYVKCLPGEGIVDVACTRLVELLRAHETEELKRRFPEASQACPFEWLRALLLVPSAERRFLCAWLRA